MFQPIDPSASGALAGPTPGLLAEYARESGYDIEWPSDILAGGGAGVGYAELYEDLLQFVDDPLGFAYYSFPWGEPGTPLADFDKLEDWQEDILRAVRDKLISVSGAIARLSIRSGHGIGKSAVVAILILWAMLREDTRGVVTANSETQLRTKTWAELGKWYQMYIGRDLFRLTATSLFPAERSKLLTWRIDLIPWSEQNTSAFQGLHNQGKRILIVFDEAAQIPKIIWTVAQGALSDANTQIIWFAAGNPTEPNGEFFNIHQPGPHNPWITRRVDSREVSFTNKDELERQIAADPDGLNSDTIKVRILGEFPSSSYTTFMSRAMVLEAMSREVTTPSDEPVRIGVDVARRGKNKGVIWPRRGRDARTLPRVFLNGEDTMRTVDEILRVMRLYGAQVVAVDGGGVGGGVVDRLRQLGVAVVEVTFGGKANPPASSKNLTHATYANKRSEIWGAVNAALPGLSLPHDVHLLEGLCAPKQRINNEDIIALEPKEDAVKRMEKEGIVGDLDSADALAISYELEGNELLTAGGPANDNPIEGLNYNPFEGIREYC